MKLMTYLNATLVAYQRMESSVYCEPKIFDRNYNQKISRQYAKFYARVIGINDIKDFKITLLQLEIDSLRTKIREWQEWEGAG